jgi:hypothetical protein
MVSLPIATGTPSSVMMSRIAKKIATGASKIMSISRPVGIVT